MAQTAHRKDLRLRRPETVVRTLHGQAVAELSGPTRKSVEGLDSIFCCVKVEEYRGLAAIQSDEFQRCLLSWITALHDITAGQVVSIDGTTFRLRNNKRSNESAINVVSELICLDHISLEHGRSGLPEWSGHELGNSRAVWLSEVGTDNEREDRTGSDFL